MMDATSPPAVEAIARFGDWLAACDNWRACEALSWTPGADAIEVSLSRRSGDAPPRVTLSLASHLRSARILAGDPTPNRKGEPRSNGPQAVSVFIDGERVSVKSEIRGFQLLLSQADQQTLWNDLPEGEVLVLVDADDRSLGRVSLRGLNAALAAVAQIQAQPPLPRTVEQPPADGTPAAPVSGADLASHLLPYGCRADETVQTYRLDATYTLALPHLHCDAQSGTSFQAAFVSGPDETLTEALFLEPGASRPDARGPLPQVGWDESDRRLSLFFDRDGLDECGVSVTYAWDGSTLAAVERRELGGCTGFHQSLTTWRAEVTVREAADR